MRNLARWLRLRTQRDAARMRPVRLVCWRRGSFYNVLRRHTAPSVSPRGVCAGPSYTDSLPTSCAPKNEQTSWKRVRTHVADVMARASACAGEWLKLLWRSGCNVDCFLAAAWDFAMLLDFARVESGRAAHICAIVFAWSVL